ncbi:MAG: ATP-binding protein [Gammaproteobacteria bacterium]|nr:ATP-binding protein [Gammaproteobacteria bacterium]MDX2461258.1 ATP-binding protein [Gammaproteobacteria bacterium]
MIDARRSPQAATASRLGGLHFTVRAKFLATCIPIALVAMTILFVIYEGQTYLSAHRDLHHKLEVISATHPAVLAEPMWNLDYERVALLLPVMEDDPDIRGVAVYGLNHELVDAVGAADRADFDVSRVRSSHHDDSKITIVSAARELLGDTSLAAAGMHDHLVRKVDIIFDTDADQQKVGELVVMLTVDHLLSTMKARLLWDGVLATALVIAVLGAAIVAYRRSVEIPLKRMLDAIEKAQKDDTPIPVSWESRDEIGELITAFNVLQARVSAHQTALTRSRDKLEEDVRIRTADLQSLNDALREGTQSLAKAEEVAHIGHWRWHLNDEHVDMSTTLCRLYGVDPDRFEATFESIQAMYHPDDAQIVKAALDKVMSDGESVEFEARIIRPDGQERWLISLGQGERNDTGQVVSLFGVSQDITERKISETLLGTAKDEAESANRAKSEFLAMMSHEIRTPMNGVLGLIGLLLDTSLDSEQRRFTEMARESGENLLAVLNGVLDLSKLEAGKLELERSDFSVAELMAGVLDLLGASARKKDLWLHYEPAEDVPDHVRGDAGRLRQVLLNLVSNAVKFTDKGGVSISVSKSSELVTEGVRLHFEVTDTGIGIPETKQARLFQPFSQVEASHASRYGGTGLGLTISKKLVELMNGQIGFQTRSGNGSSFWFHVDFSKPKDESPAVEEHAPAAPGARNTGRILLAEDSTTNAMIAVTMLRKAGHSVDSVSNGLEVVEAARTLPYDVILMDVSMPELDGFQATARIRALPGKTADIPIIAITANAMQGDREKCLAAGMNDYISKPVHRDELLDKVAVWMEVGAESSPGARTHHADAVLDEILELAALHTLVADTNPETAKQAVGMFLVELRARLTRLSAAAATLNYELLKKEAHAIKGSSGMFGARKLARMAVELEEACRTGKSADIDSLVSGMEHLGVITIAALGDHFGVDADQNNLRPWRAERPSGS